MRPRFTCTKLFDDPSTTSRAASLKSPIIGADPAGLLLSHMLHLEGIESVVLERQSRDDVEAIMRAGVLEQGTFDLLNQIGAGERMMKEGFRHEGIILRFNGSDRRIDFPSLTGGKTVMIYARHDVNKDLIKARLTAGGDICFETGAVGVYRSSVLPARFGLAPHRSIRSWPAGKLLRKEHLS